MDESYYTIGDNSHGTDFVDQALAVLDGAAPCRQLALAIGRRGTHHVRASEYEASLPWLDRAIAMGREVGDHEVVSRALVQQGRRPLAPGQQAAGRELVRESLRSRSPTTSRTPQRGTTRRWPGSDLMDFDLVEAHEHFEEAERYSAERDLHGQLMCVLASEISLKVDWAAGTKPRRRRTTCSTCGTPGGPAGSSRGGPRSAQRAAR